MLWEVGRERWIEVEVAMSAVLLDIEHSVVHWQWLLGVAAAVPVEEEAVGLGLAVLVM